MSPNGYGGWVFAFAQDLRFAARLMRFNPGFAMVAVLSLALGIGANTAIFQLLDAVRLRALPVRRPAELANVRVATQTWTPSVTLGQHPEMTYPLWERIRLRQQAFTKIA